MHKRVAKTSISVDEKLILTAPEVADLLSLGQTEVYKMARAGIIGSRKIGKRLLFPRTMVDAFVAQLCEQGVEVERR